MDKDSKQVVVLLTHPNIKESRANKALMDAISDMGEVAIYNLYEMRMEDACFAKLLQKSEMRKNMVMDLIYRGFINAANYSESHYNPRRSQIKTELRYLFVTTPNR